MARFPGRSFRGLRRAESKNPVFILDEIDKLGSDFRGDPSSALLEVLDPEQNNTFRDHYLDVPFDLSEVLFITTANVLDPVPAALRDRMEVLEIAGYTEEEKLKIAQDHLVAKQVKNHGLTPEYIQFTPDALRQVIRGYTREAGVRNLEREIGALCRKAARRRAEGNETPVEVTPDVVIELLGAPRFLDEEMEQRTKEPGVAIGLAWTPVGGDVLFIEASRMAGNGALTLTGQLGDVMKESARAALSWLRTHAREHGIDPDFFKTAEMHVHVPAGAIPKDGPSAGVTMAAAMASELTGRPVRGDVAMTGEITLSGRVLPVGGIKEKVLAARRLGINEVIVPRQNAKNINEDLTPELQEGAGGPLRVDDRRGARARAATGVHRCRALDSQGDEVERTGPATGITGPGTLHGRGWPFPRNGQLPSPSDERQSIRRLEIDDLAALDHRARFFYRDQLATGCPRRHPACAESRRRRTKLRHAVEDQFFVAESRRREESAYALYPARCESDFLLALPRRCLIGCFAFVDAAGGYLPHLASDARTVLPYQNHAPIVRYRDQHH